MSVVSLGLLAIALSANGLGSLLVPAFALMVLTSYSTLLRNGLYAVQKLGYEAAAVVLESLVLLALVFFGIKTGRGLTYFVWAYAAQYAFSCAYFVVVLAVKRIAVIGWSFPCSASGSGKACRLRSRSCSRSFISGSTSRSSTRSGRMKKPVGTERPTNRSKRCCSSR
jgi:O-antigen/teichoic acid export membrane protein